MGLYPLYTLVFNLNDLPLLININVVVNVVVIMRGLLSVIVGVHLAGMVGREF